MGHYLLSAANAVDLEIIAFEKCSHPATIPMDSTACATTPSPHRENSESVGRIQARIARTDVAVVLLYYWCRTRAANRWWPRAACLGLKIHLALGHPWGWWTMDGTSNMLQVTQHKMFGCCKGAGSKQRATVVPSMANYWSSEFPQIIIRFREYLLCIDPPVHSLTFRYDAYHGRCDVVRVYRFIDVSVRASSWLRWIRLVWVFGVGCFCACVCWGSGLNTIICCPIQLFSYVDSSNAHGLPRLAQFWLLVHNCLRYIWFIIPCTIYLDNTDVYETRAQMYRCDDHHFVDDSTLFSRNHRHLFPDVRIYLCRRQTDAADFVMDSRMTLLVVIIFRRLLSYQDRHSHRCRCVHIYKLCSNLSPHWQWTMWGVFALIKSWWGERFCW